MLSSIPFHKINQIVSNFQRTTQTKLTISKRNIERNKFKRAHADGDIKSLQLKNVSEIDKNQVKSNTIRINSQEQLDDQAKIQHEIEAQNNTGQENDFISIINNMLQKSANINAQVEQSMIKSERNLQQLETFHILNMKAK